MKAVILAGGQGSRLRPLTCDLPKPLALLCGRPVLEYLFDLLIRNGIDEAVITVGYLAHRITERYPNGEYKTLKLCFSDETQPLGTAGSVKKAAGNWEEPFFVVSGDAVCDFELSKIMSYHKACGASVTIVGYSVEDPREYGLMETDDAGRIVRFLEKPSWGQATTNLANTGVYIIDPVCLSEIPDGQAFDFASQLFPLLMQANCPLYCYHTQGYWNDIGDLSSYLQTQHDLLQGRIRFPLKKAKDGIYVQDTLPAGDYTLVPPVYIGEQVQIGQGAVIGPYTSVESGSSVGRGARLRGSLLLERSSAGERCSMEQAILCEGARLCERASMYERSIAGSRTVIGAGASVSPDVRIWPGKQIGSGALVRDDLQFGTDLAPLFGDDGLDDHVELTAIVCASLGSAIGSVPACRKIGVGCDGSNNAKAMMRAFEGGVQSCGAHVWSFGDCFEAQLSYSTAFCGLPLGVFIRGGAHPQIHLYGEGGLSLPRGLEREIESRLRRAEYRRALPESVRDVADMRSILMMYARELMKQAPNGLRNCEASVQSANAQISLLMDDTLLRLGCLRSQSLLFCISSDGMRAHAVTPDGTIEHEQLLAMCCKDAFENGMDVAVPYDAPMALDTLAKEYERTVHRYLSAPTDASDAAARRLSARQIFLRDGLYLTVRTLGILHRRQLSLQALCEELPTFYLARKSYSVSFSPAMLHELFGTGEDLSSDVREGIALRRENGRILMTPDRAGKSLHVVAEAAEMETAEEMCSGFERLLGEIEREQSDNAAK